MTTAHFTDRELESMWRGYLFTQRARGQTPDFTATVAFFRELRRDGTRALIGRMPLTIPLAPMFRRGTPRLEG